MSSLAKEHNTSIVFGPVIPEDWGDERDLDFTNFIFSSPNINTFPKDTPVIELENHINENPINSELARRNVKKLQWMMGITLPEKGDGKKMLVVIANNDPSQPGHESESYPLFLRVGVASLQSPEKYKISKGTFVQIPNQFIDPPGAETAEIPAGSKKLDKMGIMGKRLDNAINNALKKIKL